MKKGLIALKILVFKMSDFRDMILNSLVAELRLDRFVVDRCGLNKIVFFGGADCKIEIEYNDDFFASIYLSYCGGISSYEIVRTLKVDCYKRVLSHFKVSE